MNPDKTAEIADMTAEEMTPKEMTNEEEKSEVNPQKASKITTPCNIPSTSADEQGNRSHNLAKYKHYIIYDDPIVQKLTRQLFSTGNPNKQNLIDIQSALVPLELLEKIKKAKAAKKSTNNDPSPAGKGNQK